MEGSCPAPTVPGLDPEIRVDLIQVLNAVGKVEWQSVSKPQTAGVSVTHMYTIINSTDGIFILLKGRSVSASERIISINLIV